MAKNLQKVRARFHLLSAKTPNQTLGIDDGSYSIYTIDGSSRINGAYEYKVTFVSEGVLPFASASALNYVRDGALPIEEITDTDAMIVLQDDNDAKRKRKIYGKIYKIEESGSVSKQQLYTATVVSPFHYLSLNNRYKIYQEMSVIEIITDIINSSKHLLDLQVENRLDAQAFPKREICTQYNQSDAEFILMLAQEERISISFESADNEPYKMVLSYINEHARVSTEDIKGNYTLSKCFVPTAQEERYYDFENPTRNHMTKQGNTVENCNLKDNTVTKQFRTETVKETLRDRLELLDGSRAKDLQRYTKADATVDYAPAERIIGSSKSLYTEDSIVTTLHEEHTAKSIEAIITQTALKATFPNALNEYVDETDVYAFEIGFHAISTNTPFIPQEQIKKPAISGVQTAIVAAGVPDTPSGENTIDVDEFGRIRVIFHFDAARPTSCYVRLGTMFSGNNWGAQFLPRVNTEVIVSFINGNIDKPIIIGALYNGDNTIPQSLPDSKTQSYIKTRSLPGEGYNELLFEDKGGSELLSLRAQKDYKLHALNDSAINIDHDQTKEVGNDESTKIGNNRSEEVGNDENIKIGNNRSEEVGNDESIKIGNNRSEEVGNDESINIGSNESITIGSNRDVSVGSNDSLNVGSNRSLDVGGNHSVSVSKGATETITIAKALSIGAAYQVSVGGAKNVTVGLSSTEQVGLLKHIIAGNKFEISVGDSSLILNSDGSIILKGNEILIESSKETTIKGKKVEVN